MDFWTVRVGTCPNLQIQLAHCVISSHSLLIQPTESFMMDYEEIPDGVEPTLETITKPFPVNMRTKQESDFANSVKMKYEKIHLK